MKTILYICLLLFLGACSPQSTNPPKVQASVLVKNADSVATESEDEEPYDDGCDCTQDSLKYGFSENMILFYLNSRSLTWDNCGGECSRTVIKAFILQAIKQPDEAHFGTISKLCHTREGMYGEYVSRELEPLLENKKARPKFMDFVYNKAKQDSALLLAVGYGMGYDKSDEELQLFHQKLLQEGKKRKTINKKVLTHLIELANEVSGKDEGYDGGDCNRYCSH